MPSFNHQMKVLVALLIFCYLRESHAAQNNPEAILMRMLLTDYNSEARPVLSSKSPVIVEFDLKLNRIVQLATKEQLLTIDTFMMMKWFDPYLQWDYERYNGTDVINIDSSQVWTPDVVLRNTANPGQQSPKSIYKTPITVFSNGTVIWYSPVSWTSSCFVDVTWFPVDAQNCKLFFGSQSYSKSRMIIKFLAKLRNQKDAMELSESERNQSDTNLRMVRSITVLENVAAIDLRKPGLREGEHMVASGEWKIMDITASSEEKTYSCCTEPFSQLSYTFTLKRLPKYVLLYLVCPCIAIILLSVLSFVIPADSGERVGYGVTILLTMGVFLLGVSSELPKRSDAAPMLSIAYNTLFYVLMLSFAVSTINSYLIRKSTKPPETLSTLALKLVRKQRRAESFGSMIDDNGVSALLPENGNRQSMKSKRPTLKEEIEIKPMLEAKRSLGHSLAFGKEDQSDYEKQWRALANMSDKLFGYVFAAILLFTILIVFIIIVKRS